MRDVLLKRIRPMVERVATELAELMVARVEVELTRLGDAFDVALSAYASDGAPDVRVAVVADLEQAKPAAAVASPTAHPEVTTARGRTDLQANGKQPPKCSKCGFVGGNARGCGRAHPTLEAPPAKLPRAPMPVRSAGAVEADLEERRERIARVSQRTPPRSGRAPELGMRATVPQPAAYMPPEHEDDETEIERWSASRIAEETARAEATKKPGDLPIPRFTTAFVRSE